ncbi:hypothetical protein NGB36_28720 [Streptomyces sp. RB6PN25]|uniref:Transmembrane protein n=1 Tax=Streptomyces humicola TaxID=2953240 RepID=A0ABT1Q3F2_9ACTN|nr:hypothetical protein [Streptomyces humicola]MCQ4084452.1 hypothetical protein [Streptomyces humicola]
MNAASAAGAAATFTWLGMVLAISFLEAPLKFRAPGVTVPLGLGIGRIVFRALNRVEAALAIVVIACVTIGHVRTSGAVAAAIAVVLLAVQLGAIRPGLNRRSERVLAGETLPRSRAHLLYVAAESAKVVALLVLGISILAG